MANIEQEEKLKKARERIKTSMKTSSGNGVSDELHQKMMDKYGIKPKRKIKTFNDLVAFAKEEGIEVSVDEEGEPEQKESLFSRGIDLASRGMYASAGAAKAIGSGGLKENPLMAAWNGLTGKEKTTYADVLEAEGVENKIVRGAVGFALDIAFDPFTYAGGPIIKAGLKGASAVGKVGVKGAMKFQPEVAKSLIATGDSVKDAFGHAFVEGYQTSAKLDKAGTIVKELATDTAIHFNKLGMGINDIIKSYVGDYKNLPKAQHRQFAETLLSSKKEITNIQKSVEKNAFKEWGKLFPDINIKNKDQATRMLAGIEMNTVKQISSIRKRVDSLVSKETGYLESKNIDNLNTIVEGLKDELKNVERFKAKVPASTQAGIKEGELREVHSKLLSYEEERLTDVINELTNKLSRVSGKEVKEGAEQVTKGTLSIDETMVFAERKVKELQNELADKSRILESIVNSRSIAKTKLNQIKPNFATKEQEDFFNKYHKPKIDAMSDAAGIEKGSRFEYYFPSIDEERLALKMSGSGRAFSLSDQSYLKEYRAKLQNELKEPIEAMSRQNAKVFRDNETRNFLNQAVEDYGISKIDFDKLSLAEKTGYSLVKSKGQFGKEVGYLKKTDFDYLNKKLYPEYTAIDMLSKAVGYDAFTDLFKKAVTSIFPAFHIRNMISGTVQNYQALGAQALNPKIIPEGLAVMRGSEKKIFNFKEWSGNAADLKKEIQKRFSSSSRYISDYTNYIDELASGEFKMNRALGKLNPRKIGNFIETKQKTEATIIALKQGKTLNEALRLAEKAGFDYTRLTSFEGKIMRRLIPFYSFARKNAALQVSTLKNHPERIINQAKLAEAFSNMFGGNVSEDDLKGLPPWVLSGLGFKLSEGKYVSKFGLPLEEFLARVNDPAMSTLTSLNPLVKYGLESKMGYDFFRDQKIIDVNKVAPASGELFMKAKKKGLVPDWLANSINMKSHVSDYDGETKYTASPKALHILRNIPTSRIQSTLEKIFDNDMDKVNKWIGFFSGGKIYNIDMEQQRYFTERDITRDTQDALISQGVGKRMEIFYLPKN